MAMQQHCFQRRPMHQPYFGSRQSLAAGHARSTNNSNPSFVQHRRANSDHQFGETSHGLFSTDDSIEQNLQNYLPKSLIDELVDTCINVYLLGGFQWSAPSVTQSRVKIERTSW